MRVVIDTNLLVSALISKPGSTPRRLLDEVIAGRIEIVLSRPLIDEFVDVITRAKFARYLTIGAALDFLDGLLAVAWFVEITGASRGCSDPDDDAVIETAEVGAADFLITGDRRDLLTESVRQTLASSGIEVTTASAFLQGSQQPGSIMDQARRIVAAEAGSAIAHSTWQKKAIIESLQELVRRLQASHETLMERLAWHKAEAEALKIIGEEHPAFAPRGEVLKAEIAKTVVFQQGVHASLLTSLKVTRSITVKLRRNRP